MPHDGASSDCPDTIMDRFSGVWPISLAAVFRRRSRHVRYIYIYEHDQHSTAERTLTRVVATVTTLAGIQGGNRVRSP